MSSKQSSIRRAPTPEPTFTGFRRHGRREMFTQIIVQDESGWEFPLDSVNLSPSGLFVESAYLFEVGEEHTLIFESPDAQRWFRVTARVVRVEEGEEFDDHPTGMAYEFVETDEETWETLCSYVTA